MERESGSSGPVSEPYGVHVSYEDDLSMPTLKTEPIEADETNPKDIYGVKKPQLNLVPQTSIIYQALAMEDGAQKYGPFNWREKKVKASIYVAACQRHLAAWFDSREELAQDSKRPHLGHAIACLGILVDAYETGNLVDDRPLPGAAAELVKKWEAIKKEELSNVSE